MSEPRRPGRPALDDKHPSVKVCFSLSGPHYDALWRRAQRDRTSVGSVIRRTLLAAEDDDADD